GGPQLLEDLAVDRNFGYRVDIQVGKHLQPSMPYWTGLGNPISGTIASMRNALVLLLASVAMPAEKPRLNPAVQEIVRAVSDRRMEATLKKLEGFGTRHIHSSQEDPEHGIGAAQRWIFQEFQSYSPRLEVSYDKFSLKKGGGTRGRVIRDVDLANVVAVL